MIEQAQGQTAATITRIMLTFVGVAVFCLLSLLTPDAALLTGGERLHVPFAGPVSFRGFIIIGPALLIVLRIYLQIYVDHWRRLEPIRARLPAPWVPTVAPLKIPLLRAFVWFVLYLLLPFTMVAFTWKAAVHPGWGSGVLCIAAAVIAWHLVLPFEWSRGSRALFSGGAAMLIAGGAAMLIASMVLNSGGSLVSRPANLFRADLSNQWLLGSDLKGADIRGANLVGATLQVAQLNLANLAGANLRRADLWGANLEGANLRRANLERADLEAARLILADLEAANLESAFLAFANLLDANLAGANIRSAYLYGANLTGANLTGANLTDAALTQAQLNLACGNEATKLPDGLSIKRCAD